MAENVPIWTTPEKVNSGNVPIWTCNFDENNFPKIGPKKSQKKSQKNAHKYFTSQKCSGVSQATGMQNLHLPPETCQANCKQYKLTSLYA